MTAPLVFPIGHYVGMQHETGQHVVRVGWELYRLEGNEQFGVWALAHGVPEQGEPGPWTRPAVEGAARVAGIAGAEGILDDLLERDLIIEVSPGADDAAEFARDTRLRPLLLGLGQLAADPRRYGIGLAAGKPLVAVPAFVYELWKWSPGWDSLWHACEIMARAGRDVPGEDTDPARVLARCLPGVQLLIAHGAGYLDEASEDWGLDETSSAAVTTADDGVATEPGVGQSAPDAV